MVNSTNVPNTNAGRESANTIWGWITYLDLIIALVFDIAPGVIVMSFVSGWWLLVVVVVMVGWFIILTYPKLGGGTKLYFWIWDIFVWFGTTKKYSGNEKDKFNTQKTFNNIFEPYNEKDEENLRWATIYLGKKETKSRVPYMFYEIITTDISLMTEAEIDLIMNKYNSLFQLTDEIQFSQVKVDWNYNFDSNIDHLQGNIDEWHKEKKKDSDVLVQLNVDKIRQLNEIQSGATVLQKRYFLIISGNSVDVINRGFNNVHNDLLEAGLFLKACEKEDVEVCLKKLIPTYGNNKPIKFTAKGYEVGEKEDKMYYRSVMVTTLPKMVGQFWNQELFNLNNVTVNMQFLNITEKQKNRYTDKLKQLADERKAKTMSDKAAKYAELEAINQLALDIGIGGAKIKRVKYFITYCARTKTELRKLERSLKNIVSKNKMKLNLCWMKQWDAYMANIPLFNSWMGREANMFLTDITLTLAYPYTYSDYIDDKGDYFGYMTDSGNPIMIDFTKVNREVNSWSTLVIGKTGGGKSTCTKLMGTSFILNPRYRKLFFVDPENEYTTMVKNYNGDVIDCSGQLDSGRINPFHIYMAGDEEGNGAGDRYMAWQQHFYFLNDFFMNLFNKELDQKEISILINIITKIYKEHKIDSNTDFQKVKAEQFPTFTDLAEYLDKLIHGKAKHSATNNINLLEKLFAPISLYAKESKICPGNFANLWDGPSNIKVDNRIISFNLQKLLASSVPNNIKSAQMQLLLRFVEDLCIANKKFNENLGIYNNDEKCLHTAVFCDEFHLLADKNFTKPIQWFYHFVKRIRKYKGKLIPITQNIKDLTASPDIIQYTSGIVNSCQFMFTFHLNAMDIDDLDKLFTAIGGLKSEEKIFLKGKTKGECIFGVGNETRIKMRFDYEDGLTKDMIEKNMSEYKNLLIQAEKDVARGK